MYFGNSRNPNPLPPSSFPSFCNAHNMPGFPGNDLYHYLYDYPGLLDPARLPPAYNIRILYSLSDARAYYLYS